MCLLVREEQPATILVDRGNRLSIQATGGLAAQYAAALREHGFKNCTGGNCASQVGQMGDVLLHETAVAWTDTATLEQ